MEHITFQFDRPIPKECEGKTLKEVFDLCMSKQEELIEKAKKLEALTVDERTYLEMIQMFKKMATGEGELKLVSPYHLPPSN